MKSFSKDNALFSSNFKDFDISNLQFEWYTNRNEVFKVFSTLKENTPGSSTSKELVNEELLKPVLYGALVHLQVDPDTSEIFSTLVCETIKTVRLLKS